MLFLLRLLFFAFAQIAAPEFMLGVLTLLVGAAVSILLAFIPWGFKVSSELASIKKDVAAALKLERRVRALEFGDVLIEEDDE